MPKRLPRRRSYFSIGMVSPRGMITYLALLTLSTILRPITASEAARPGLGRDLIYWNGSLYTYDAGIAVLFLDDAHKGDHTADRVLCNAAAVLLVTTGGIADQRLRMYAAKRLSGDIRVAKNKGRGRNASDNSYRDSLIAGRLIPPLLTKFHATRNAETSDQECACSIVSSALGRVGIRLSERRIAEIWAKVSDRFGA